MSERCDTVVSGNRVNQFTSRKEVTVSVKVGHETPYWRVPVCVSPGFGHAPFGD